MFYTKLAYKSLKCFEHSDIWYVEHHYMCKSLVSAVDSLYPSNRIHYGCKKCDFMTFV